MAGPSMAVFGRKLTKSVTELGESEGELGQWVSDQPLNPLGMPGGSGHAMYLIIGQ